jgi:hypothetical protein
MAFKLFRSGDGSRRIWLMKKALLLAVLLMFCLSAAFGASSNPPTMRVDFYHSGNDKTQSFSLDRVVIEPLPWPGSMSEKARIDQTNLGKYLFEVRDRAKGDLLYSRGFSSIFGEWESTEEAKTMNRTFSESLRFPRFEQPLTIVLKQRDEQNNWKQAWSTDVDAKDMFVDSSKPESAGSLITIEKNGDSAEKVDFLILGDGYTVAKAEMRSRCATTNANPVFDFALPGARKGFQRLGIVPCGARERSLAAIDRNSQTFSHRCDLRRFRIGTLHPDV